MSLKSKQQLRDAIFYAGTNPDALFSILFDKVKDTPVATKVVTTGDRSLTLSSTVSVTTEAPKTEVLDQYSDVMSGQTVTYALKTTVTGCSVDSSTGVLTATTSAVAGGKPVIVATSGSLTSELEVTLVSAL